MEDSYHRDRIANRQFHPETLRMGYGYAPGLSEGSLKPPIFLTSTFVFENAQQGKDFFDLTSGRHQPRPGEKSGLVYSRFNNPNLEILEDRLAIWDQAERSAVFASGMAAISTTLFAFLRAGDTILQVDLSMAAPKRCSRSRWERFGSPPSALRGINTAEKRKTAEAARAKGRVGLILVETPANPTNGLVDLAACAAIADELAKSQGHRPPVVVDNTMLGPMFQTPLKCGADISLCSLTKYVGGHSDLVGGSISGDANLVKQVMGWRSSIGTQLDPNSCWMLMRSLETLEIRMTRSNANARLVAEYLAGHPKIARVHYLGFLKEGDPHKTVFDRQCSAPGSTFAFDVNGGEKEAFALLDHLQIMKLAVSLGGTETLISHPASMTHSGVARELREEIGLSDALIRISIGIENVEDLISDLAQGLEYV